MPPPGTRAPATVPSGVSQRGGRHLPTSPHSRRLGCDPGSGDGDCTVVGCVSWKWQGSDFRTSSPRRSGCRPSHRVPDWYHRRRAPTQPGATSPATWARMSSRRRLSESLQCPHPPWPFQRWPRLERRLRSLLPDPYSQILLQRHFLRSLLTPRTRRR